MQASYYPATVPPQRAPSGFDMNHLYLSPSQQQTSRPGLFHKRNERIDWRRIAAVDVDRIARDMDFQALQDNLEQITLCNIDAETDARGMDPNFLKLYKMAQLTIDYLLLCQDQIGAQLADYDQIKNKNHFEHENAQRQIDSLKHDLSEAKKESKKRRKMLETQQRMLMAQNSNYHTCPVCTHAFLSVAYLQAHMARRHPEYDPHRRREHDVDAERENQRLKDELNKKEAEFQMLKNQKTVDDDKLRDRDANMSKLRDENQNLRERIAISDYKSTLQAGSNDQTRSSSPQRRDADTSELLKENRSLNSKIDKLKEELQQAKVNLKTEEKLRKQYEADNKRLYETNAQLQKLQTTHGDKGRFTDESSASQNRYKDDRAPSVRSEEGLQVVGNQSRPNPQPQPQPPPPTPTTVIDRKSPVQPVESPVQMRPARPVQGTEIMLPEYCPSLVRRIKENPKCLTAFRDDAKKQYLEELEDSAFLGISETDTRLTDLDFRTKMEKVLQTRRIIENDLPNFENVRSNLSRTLERLVTERADVRRSISSNRSAGSKLVTFKDEHQRQKHTSTIYDNHKTSSRDQHRVPPPPPTTTTTVQSKSRYDRSRPAANQSDEDVTISNVDESDDDDTQPTRPGISTDIQPSPRKHPPTNAISALVTTNIRPSTASTNTGSTVSAIVRQPVVKATPTTDKFDSDSDSDSRPPPPSTNIAEKTRFIEQKLRETSKKDQKPSVNAIAQGFQPSKQSVSTRHGHDDDDNESESLTTLHTHPPQKATNGHLPQLSVRELANNNPLSSGDISQHSYGSLWKSQNGKGTEPRRPPTADSAKTSHMDSYDGSDGEVSN